MSDQKKKILILDGGAAHAMAIAECLKKSGYSIAVHVTTKTNMDIIPNMQMSGIWGKIVMRKTMQSGCSTSSKNIILMC